MSLPDATTQITDVARVIQLAVAPVFLLSGIGAFLNVMAGRLGRTVDRARRLEGEIGGFDPGERLRALTELHILDRRMRLAHFSIYACTASALAVCVLVALLFVADLSGIGFARTVAVLFVVAMALIVLGLGFFLAEVRLATISVRVRRDLLPKA